MSDLLLGLARTLEATLTHTHLTKDCINQDIDHPAFATNASTSLTISSNIYNLTIQLYLQSALNTDHPHLLDMLSLQINRKLSLKLSTAQTFNTQQKIHLRDTTTENTTPIFLLCKIRSIKPEFKLIHLSLSFVQSSINHHTQLITLCGIDPLLGVPWHIHVRFQSSVVAACEKYAHLCKDKIEDDWNQLWVSPFSLFPNLPY